MPQHAGHSLYSIGPGLCCPSALREGEEEGVLSWVQVSPDSRLTSVSSPVPSVTRACFSLQVQHVYPAQVQYVEGGDAVYANGAMYVCSVRALVPHRLTTPLLPHSQFSPTPIPEAPVQGHSFCALGF